MTLTKTFNFKEGNLEVTIHRTLVSEGGEPCPKDEIVVKIGDKIHSFIHFSQFFNFVDRKVEPQLRDKLYFKLDDTDLCIRCGYCCTTGAPLVTVEDIRTLLRSNVARNVLRQVFEKFDIKVRVPSSMLLTDPECLMVMWNSAIDFLKPCPFLEITHGLARCRIYTIRPSFCKLFKCWSPYTDMRRRQHVEQVLRELENIGRRRPELSVYVDIAQNRATFILSVL